MITLPDLLQAFSDLALAADPPEPPDCGALGLPTCGAVGGNIFAENMAPFVARMVVYFAIGLSLIMVLWSGLRLMLNNGDEGKVGTARMGLVYALGGLALALMSQNIVSFIITQDFGDVSSAPFEVMRHIAKLIVDVFNPLFIIMIIFAGIRLVLDRGKEDEFNKARTGILWACGGAIVLNLGYALVSTVMSIFGV